MKTKSIFDSEQPQTTVAQKHGCMFPSTVKHLSLQKRSAEPDDNDSPTKRTIDATEGKGEVYENAPEMTQHT
jgi:hypothetical protein